MTYHSPNTGRARVIASPYAVAKQNQARAAIARMSSGLGQTSATTPAASLLPPPVQDGGATGLKIGWAAVALLAIGIFWYTANPPHSVIGNKGRRRVRRNGLSEYRVVSKRAGIQTKFPASTLEDVDRIVRQVKAEYPRAVVRVDHRFIGGPWEVYEASGVRRNRTVVTPGRISMIEERLRHARSPQEQRKAIHSAQYALEDLYEYAPDSADVKRIRRSINTALGFRQNRGRRKRKLAKNRYWYYANPSRRVKPNRYWYYAN